MHLKRKKGHHFRKYHKQPDGKRKSHVKSISSITTFLKTQAPDKKGQKHDFDWYESTEENKKVF